MRRSTSPLVFSRFGAIESISSMKMIAGEFFSASSHKEAAAELFDVHLNPVWRKPFFDDPLVFLKYTVVFLSDYLSKFLLPS